MTKWILGIVILLGAIVSYTYLKDNKTVTINTDLKLQDEQGNLVKTLLKGSVIKVSRTDSNGKTGVFKNSYTANYYTFVDGVKCFVPLNSFA